MEHEKWRPFLGALSFNQLATETKNTLMQVVRVLDLLDDGGFLELCQQHLTNSGSLQACILRGLEGIKLNEYRDGFIDLQSRYRPNEELFRRKFGNEKVSFQLQSLGFEIYSQLSHAGQPRDLSYKWRLEVIFDDEVAEEIAFQYFTDGQHAWSSSDQPRLLCALPTICTVQPGIDD